MAGVSVVFASRGPALTKAFAQSLSVIGRVGSVSGVSAHIKSGIAGIDARSGVAI